MLAGDFFICNTDVKRSDVGHFFRREDRLIRLSLALHALFRRGVATSWVWREGNIPRSTSGLKQTVFLRKYA